MVGGFIRLLQIQQRETRNERSVLLLDKDHSLIYRMLSDSIPGRFVFSLRNEMQFYVQIVDALKLKYLSYLVVLRSDGNLLLSRSLLSFGEPTVFYNFGIFDEELYAFFTGNLQDLKENRSSVRFLSRTFDEVRLPGTAYREKDLDGHDLLKMPNQNIMFLFEQKNDGDATIANEIQERNPHGDTVFRWNSQFYIDKKKDEKFEEIDPLHLNSIAMQSKNTLALSFNRISRIIGLKYPTQEILWEIDAKNWKFINDTYGGFVRQHTIHFLKNGDLLLFDNGNGLPPRRSRAVQYKLDFDRKEITQVWEFQCPNAYPIREGEGSVQRLSNGNTLIGWGHPSKQYGEIESDTVFTEVAPDGKITRELISEPPLYAYKVYFDETSN